MKWNVNLYVFCMRVKMKNTEFFFSKMNSLAHSFWTQKFRERKKNCSFWQSTVKRMLRKFLKRKQIEILHWRSCGHMLELNWILNISFLISLSLIQQSNNIVPLPLPPHILTKMECYRVQMFSILILSCEINFYLSFIVFSLFFVGCFVSLSLFCFIVNKIPSFFSLTEKCTRK